MTPTRVLLTIKSSKLLNKVNYKHIVNVYQILPMVLAGKTTHWTTLSTTSMKDH